jgi:hypothetical protein
MVGAPPAAPLPSLVVSLINNALMYSDADSMYYVALSRCRHRAATALPTRPPPSSPPSPLVGCCVD